MTLETVFAFFDVRWSLGSEDTGNVNSGSGGGANAVEVRNKSGANSGEGEVSFYHAEFALSIFLPFIKLNSLALYCLKFALMRSIPKNISDNTRVPEINDGVVDEESRGGRRMENVEVVVFDPGTIEVGSGMCSCMEGDRILGVAALVSPYKMSVDPNLPKDNIACYLILSVLIEEDKWVLPCISTVVLAPPSSWMVWVKLLSELRDIRNGTRCRGEGDGGVVLSKPNWFIVLYVDI